MITRRKTSYKFRANCAFVSANRHFRDLYCDMSIVSTRHRVIKRDDLPKRQAPRAAGFILVATLFAIAVIAIGATYFASRVEGLQAAAFQQQSVTEAEREAVSIGQALIQAVLLNPITERGLVIKDAPNEPLLLDGRFYRMSDKTQIAIQDERGLMSLNINDDLQLRRFFSAAGLPVGRHDRLLDTLRDYVDVDDFKRLNGAERRDYIEAKLPPPANDFFTSRDELRRIPGWRELLAELDARGKPGAAERFLGYFSADRVSAINLNTAPRLIVQSLVGIDQARITALLDQRRLAPFQSVAELASFTNGAIDLDMIQLVGASTWRLTYQRDDLAFLIECRLVITPAASDKAAQVNECRHRPRNSIPTDDDVEDFARVFSTPFSTRFSLSTPVSSTGPGRANKNSPADFQPNAKSIFPFLLSPNREVSQPTADSRSLPWLILKAGLSVEPAAPAQIATPRP